MNNINYFHIYENKYIYMKKSNSCCTLHSTSIKIASLRNSKTPYEIETYRHLGNSFPIANTSNHDYLIKAKMPIPSNPHSLYNTNTFKPRYTHLTKIKKPSDIAKEAITKIKTNHKQIYQNNSINNKLFYKSFNSLTDDSSFEFNFNANDSFGNTNNSCIIMHNNNTTNIKVKHINNSKSCINVNITNDKIISYVLNVLGIDNDYKDVFIRMQIKFKHLLNYSKKMLMRLGIGVIIANRIDNFNKEYKMFLKKNGKNVKGSEREKVEMFFKNNRKFIFDKSYKKNLDEGICKESNKNRKGNGDGFVIESMGFSLYRTYIRKINYNVKREKAAHKLYMKYKKVTKEVEMFLNKFHNNNTNHYHHYHYTQLKGNYIINNNNNNNNNSCNSSYFNNNNNHHPNYSMRSIKLKSSLSSSSNKINLSLSKNPTINSYSCLHFQK